MQVFAALCALLISASTWLVLGQGLKLLIDEGFLTRDLSYFSNMMLLVIGIVVIGSIATYFRFYFMTWLGERVSGDIRSGLFSHLTTLDPYFYEKTQTGEVISRFTSDTTLLQSVIGSSFSMSLRSIFMFIGSLILMGISSLKLTLMVFVAVPFILIPIRVFGAQIRKHSGISQDKVAALGTMIDETLHEIHTVQSYNHQQSSNQLFQSRVEALVNQAQKRIRYRALLIALVMMISMFAIFGVAYLGAVMVFNDNLSVGELSAFMFYAVLAGTAIATVSEVIGELQKAAGASQRIVELLEERTQIIDSGKQTEIKTDNKKAIIEIKDLSFSYPSAPDIKVINNLNLSIKRGQKIAIVGKSGAGKSTLFQLIQRFYPINHGEIKMFDLPIEQYNLETLRRQFALVPQDAVIFASSIFDNIAFGAPGASEQDIFNAAKLAHADEFIRDLPQQYQTDVGERGVKLSGGQKQRIAIARAIAAKRPILLLDEATSALDANSEHLVKQALNELMKNKTTLIIAHRLSTVVDADKIIVLEKGKVIASGTHNELYGNNSVYQEFVDLQLVK